jgi:hypothetical protein
MMGNVDDGLARKGGKEGKEGRKEIEWLLQMIGVTRQRANGPPMARKR